MLSQHFGLRSKLKVATTSRTRAYDPDLRWRMIYQRIVLELPFKTISKNLYVDVSTVRLTVELFNSTGSVDKQLASTEKID